MFAMSEHPDRVARRISPDQIQLQVVLGSLLGKAAIVGPPGERRLRVSERPPRAGYVQWKYERLVGLTGEAPHLAEGRFGFETVAHPLFDDLAGVGRPELLGLLRPLGLAVWMSDLGRLDLRRDAFLPAQREQLCEAATPR